MTAYEQGLARFLRDMLEQIPPKERRTLEELRLREGFPLSAVQAGIEWTHTTWRGRSLTEEDLRRVLETAGRGSVHTVLDQLRGGYVTAPNGLRIGGTSQHRTAMAVAGERKYRDFRKDNRLDTRQFQLAFRTLRQLSAQVALIGRILHGLDAEQLRLHGVEFISNAMVYRKALRLMRTSVNPTTVLLSYVTLAEIESKDIITIVESVFYKLPADEIRQLITIDEYNSRT